MGLRELSPSRVHFVSRKGDLAKYFNFDKSLLIFDERLLKTPEGRAFIERFSFKYRVQAGEKLKDLHFFPKHIEKIFKLLPTFSRKEWTVVALGGGSIGDFAGFIASILHRGVGFTQVPTTWLAAIDSAHGGKTALNFGSLKNQLGTFYFPEKTVLFPGFLPQTPERVLEASGELLKAAFLDSKFRSRFLKLQKLDSLHIWKSLPWAIQVKMNFVKADPFEEKGVRIALNLGHTLAHAFERTFSLPHGLAVLFGLEFALKWSLHRGMLSSKDFLQVSQSPFMTALRALKNSTPWRSLHLHALLQKPSVLIGHIQRDKKRSNNKKQKGLTQEIFINKKSFEVHLVSDEDFLKEIKRQQNDDAPLF